MRRRLVAVLSGAALLAGTTVPFALSSAPAAAASVSSLRQKASVLAGEIQTNYDKLDVLDEGYNQAHARVVTLGREITTAKADIAKARRELAADRAHLRGVAITAYIDGGSGAGLAVLLAGNSGQAPMQQAYLQAASGNLAAAEASVTNARHHLAGREATLEKAEKGAKAAEEKIATERRTAAKITAQLESELSSVKGSLAKAVAAAEAQRQLQAAAAARAASLVKQQQATPPPPPAPTPPAPTPPSAGNPAPVSGGGSGAVAVRAAESQLGVPYVWGGATPGVGFDCSGLTMWSWAQAGVTLAHGATEQYYEIAHVSMSNLQPGDLIFYGNASYLYHVVMYVGSGPYGADTVIQAQQTGTNVMFTPIPPGAYGAGQP